MTARVRTLQANKQKRNDKIKEEFRKRYTDAARPRMYSREYVLAQIAEERDLSIATVEDIIYAKQPRQKQQLANAA
ncbi:hypothetical protein GCM10011383_37560 [Hymenobacter cavernae]|uniref:Uncharacterized protein n=1 Tax=Hymenobacter cavernae TaxID=2044852 RepID=A0ABQ1UML4_9BACT|nr:hypothetical protein GCM10011383_37560 [Hymenobacter cavernae]